MKTEAIVSCDLDNMVNAKFKLVLVSPHGGRGYKYTLTKPTHSESAAAPLSTYEVA